MPIKPSIDVSKSFSFRCFDGGESSLIQHLSFRLTEKATVINFAISHRFAKFTLNHVHSNSYYS